MPTGRPSDFQEGLILIVDDDPAWREVAALVLKRLGCSVITAESVEEAVMCAKTIRPAAIVMDVGMERGEGWMLLRVLASDMSTAQIPVIVASAHNDILNILAAGAKAVLKKPVQHDELAGALKRVGACPSKFIVAVDEDPKALDLYERLLSPQGFHVVRCTSANRVDSIIEKTNPALVLMNWMTVLSSGETLERDDIPVVGVAPHALSPRVRAELRGRLPVELIPSDGTRPSFRGHLGDAIRAAAMTSKPPSLG